jgi:hypothetical protein
MTDTPSDPFDSFDDMAELLAFLAKKYGLSFIRDLLAQDCREVPAKPWLLTQAERIKISTRESFEATADALQDIGLNQLAKLVREHAVTRPSMLDLPPYPPGSINHRAWLAGRAPIGCNNR